MLVIEIGIKSFYIMNLAYSLVMSKLLWNHQISCVNCQIAVTSTRIWTSLESPDKLKNGVVPTRVIEFR